MDSINVKIDTLNEIISVIDENEYQTAEQVKAHLRMNLAVLSRVVEGGGDE